MFSRNRKVNLYLSFDFGRPIKNINQATLVFSCLND